jgi:hypothetical protein
MNDISLSNEGVHGNQLDFDKYKPRTKEEQAPGNPTFEVCRDTRDSLRQIADTAIGIGNVSSVEDPKRRMTTDPWTMTTVPYEPPNKKESKPYVTGSAISPESVAEELNKRKIVLGSILDVPIKL